MNLTSVPKYSEVCTVFMSVFDFIECFQNVIFCLSHLTENMSEDDMKCQCFAPCLQTTFESRLSHADLSKKNLQPYVLSAHREKKRQLQVLNLPFLVFGKHGTDQVKAFLAGNKQQTQNCLHFLPGQTLLCF